MPARRARHRLPLATLLTGAALALVPAAHADRAPVPASRGHFLALASGDEVVVVGGRAVPSGATVRPIERVEADGTWRIAGRLRTGRAYHTATALADGRILIAGGQTFDGGRYGTTGTTELYDPARDKSRAGPTLDAARQGHRAVLLADGSLLVAGDMSGVRTTERWSPDGGGGWTSAGDLPMAISRHALVARPDGGAVLVGGSGVTFRRIRGTRVQRSQTLDGVLLWNADDGAWSSGGLLHEARAGATATLLPDGQLLVVGGADERHILRSAELCDLARGTCKPTGPLARARTGHQAVLLASGLVAVIGGETGPVAAPKPVLDIELYDPRTRRWRTTTIRITQAHDVQVAALTGGELLVLGLDPRCKADCTPTTTRLRLD